VSSTQAFAADMSGPDTRPRPVISAIAAELFVADIKASCDFFTQKLGFSIVFTYGEPPFYAQVKRDRALLNLKCVDYPVMDPALRDRESLLSADMAVDTHEEIEQLSLEFQAAGITLFQTLKKEAWGAKTFIVKDPDGNLLLFAGPAD
jgi:catechol 2,3-dioxygenase-like lactoylglutathione lyase family enzyme